MWPGNLFFGGGGESLRHDAGGATMPFLVGLVDALVDHLLQVRVAGDGIHIRCLSVLCLRPVEVASHRTF